MNRALFASYILLLYFILPVLPVSAQEAVGPIRWNPVQNSYNNLPARAARTTSTTLTLPFFDDFTGYGSAPDSLKWTDFEVYINNTMGVSPVSRGVATFDDLNAGGIPYDSFTNTSVRNADSLTSRQIDLSLLTPADSVYLSFFYQPQGNGFYPLLADSLMLFMKNRYGQFVKIWSVRGNTLQPFQQVMIPVTDTLYFHNAFQFRFTNKAALFWADAVWNVDYVRMDKNRNINDTAVNDVAFTTNPSFLLNDYTFMPYDQFTANPASEIAAFVYDSIRNNALTGESVNYTVRIRDAGSGTPLQTPPLSNILMGAATATEVSEPIAIATYPTYAAGTSVVFETTWFLQTTTPVGSVLNDSVVRNQSFDNYLAYDDGTAEKAYYLNLFSSLPGRIAIEYHLNHPDTLRGMAIYFGRQIPFSSAKLFLMYVYSALEHVNGAPATIALDSTDLLTPAYANGQNHFWYYTFPRPVPLPAGTFYAGTLQPLGGFSDSLYFGLDVNRIGGNHAWYNVNGNWVPSGISGAIMMRPLLGHYVSDSWVREVHSGNEKWDVFPNPAKDNIHFRFESDARATYCITDIQGRILKTGTTLSGSEISVQQFSPGMYFVTLTGDGLRSSTQKFIKL